MDSRRRGLIANWVRGEGIWHVDTLGRGASVQEFYDAARYSLHQSVMSGSSAPERLRSLADYLDIDWNWLHTRCGEMGHAGWERLLHLRSGLLGVTALNAVCTYVVNLGTGRA
jgi:hypothetical protein